MRGIAILLAFAYKDNSVCSVNRLIYNSLEEKSTINNYIGSITLYLVLCQYYLSIYGAYEWQNHHKIPNNNGKKLA